MKKVMVTAMVVFAMCLMLATPLFATGPTNAGGESLFVPFNLTAMENSSLIIMPLWNENLGSATTIWEDDVTITVSEIPLADCDEEFLECEGTWIQLNWSRAWEAGEWTKQAWCQYKFWLNGSGPVTITREYNGTIETEEVTEFIFFKVQWVGNGEGNSDFDIGRNFDIKIQAYK